MAHLPELACEYRGECPCYDNPSECVCMEAEAVLRCYAEGWPRTAMRPEQRELCLEEIAHVEGYDRKDYEVETDQGLARGVLHAWVSYCRNLGLI